MKTALLGLSGNPTHMGHLAMACHAREHFGVAQVLLMIAPYNTVVKKQYAPYEHRLAMAELAARSIDPNGTWLHVSNFEEHLEFPHGQPETIDTLRAFQQQHPSLQPVWMMGTDGLQFFDQWLGWEEILAEFPCVIYNRTDSKEVRLADAFHNQTVLNTLQKRIIPHHEFTATAGQCCWVAQRISPASATEIRTAIANGQAPHHVPPSVYRYMQQHQLYMHAKTSDL